MLVPHEPYVDPRVQWVTELCRQIARTEILTFVSEPTGPAVTYDGVVSLEQCPWQFTAPPSERYRPTFVQNVLRAPADLFRRANLDRLQRAPGAICRQAVLEKLLRLPGLVGQARTRVGNVLLGGRGARRATFERVLRRVGLLDWYYNGFAFPGFDWARLDSADAGERFRTRPLHGTPDRPRGLKNRLTKWLDYHYGGLCHTSKCLDWLHKIITTVRTRAETVLVPPRVVICHDLWSLAAGVDVKRRFGCRLIYDAHEFAPQANLTSHPVQQWYWQTYERHLVRHADAVISVTPQLADEYRRRYALTRVCCVPNAEPFDATRPPPRPADAGYPVRFLVQGAASPGRGFEGMLDAWRELDDPRALLFFRCTQGEYVEALKARYADLIDRGRVEFLPPVRPDELVAGAAFADVGVIPYPVRVGEGENLNHVYCCPNKLSQYMQAGLALLCSNSGFLSQCLDKYRCGVVYDPDDRASLVAAVRGLIDDLPRLRDMRRSAWRWARDDFNWERQSDPYRRLLEEFVGPPETAVVRRAA
jgi:glycosyltransferase involved in cell wall biosynthesis